MAIHAGASRPKIEDLRTELAARLRARSGELQEAIATRVYAISDPREVDDAEYLNGLQNALAVALDYALTAVERGERRAPEVPPVLLVQARMAARHRISLETVLRRYLAGYSLLTEFVFHETEDGELVGDARLQQVLHGQAAVFDRLIAAVAEEYVRAAGARAETAEERRAEQVVRLLAGESIDTSDWVYDLTGHHVALIAKGPGSGEAFCEIARRLDRQLLSVRKEEHVAWGWLGGRRRLDFAELQRVVASVSAGRLPIALGETGDGIAGWRFTHRQAQAALPVALHGSDSVVRYAEAASLASLLQDELLVASLREIYLQPLAGERGGGDTLLTTLRAYFAAQCNVSSAAAALEMSRQAVAHRLQVAEQRLGRPIASCRVDLELALRLEFLDQAREKHVD